MNTATGTVTLAPWWADHSELSALVSWLDDTGRANDIRDAVAVLEKPWNWENERAAMLADRAGAVFFACYDRDSVDTEVDDVTKLPANADRAGAGVAPVSSKDIASVCEEFNISAQVFNAAGELVGRVDRLGDWKREAA